MKGRPVRTLVAQPQVGVCCIVVWFITFLAGLLLVAYGLIRALRSRKPDLWMANGGMIAAIGFIGFSRWPAAVIPAGMNQQSAAFMGAWWGGWLAAVWASYQLVWSLRALTWPSVQGTLTQSEAVFMGINNSTTIGPRGSTKHWWKVAYTYAVDGVNYSGTNKALDTDDQDSNFSGVSKKVAEHPPGSSIRVYHHPRDPQLACIDRGWFNGRWLAPAMYAVVLFWVAGLE